MAEPGALGPQEALEAIAFALERALAPTYRVRAFRAAAAVVSSTDPERLGELARKGRLTDLKGIGDTTAQVITEALAGQVPAYLEQVEAAAPDPAEALSPAVADLLGRIRGDCHSHSDWSDGGSPIATMAAAAEALGHEYLALTDHSPRLTVAHGLDPERLRAQLEVVAEVNRSLSTMRLLTGIEVDILEDGGLDQEPDLLDRLDVVVASVHSKLRMESRPMTARMIAAVSDRRVDVLGHCTGRLLAGRGRPQSTFDAPAVFAACAAHGTAVEINSRPERLDPPDDLLAVAVAEGCLFAIDTDAHAPGQLTWQANGAAKAVACAVDPERIINTWDFDRLLAWAAS